MAATKITPKEFVAALKDWSILDVVEAVKAIEDEFGIKAAAPVAVAAVAGPAAGGEAAPAEEEQTEFTVTLTAVGDSKINVIKAVRELTQLGLKEAKDLVDAAPKPVLEDVSKADADKAVARLKEAGATAELKSRLVPWRFSRSRPEPARSLPFPPGPRPAEWLFGFGRRSPRG